MNQKGTTLMEMLTAIFILSIAGLMITTSFITVIRMMGDANTIQYQSDHLLSYAEKKDDEKLKDQIKETPQATNGVSISNDTGKTVIMDGFITDVQYKADTKVSLKLLQTTRVQTVSDSFPQAFQDVVEYHNKIYSFIANNTDLENSNNSYNDVFLNGSGFSNPPIEFPIKILPRAEQKPYYVQELFPWEIKTSANSVTHGGSLMFLSSKPLFANRIEKETLHFVFDVENNIWFYQSSTDYVLNYDVKNCFEKGISCIQYKNRDIESIEELQSLLQAETYGWKKLYKGTILNTEDTDSMWK